MSWEILYQNELPEFLAYLEENNFSKEEKERLRQEFIGSCKQRESDDWNKQPSFAHLTSEEMRRIEASARKATRYTMLDKKWQQLFSKRSHYNEQAGKCMLYSFLSSLLCDIKIDKASDRKMPMKLHYIWIQNSRCLDENEQVQTDKGNIALKDLPQFFNVLSFNFDTLAFEMKPAYKLPAREKVAYEIILDGDYIVKASAMHRFFNEERKERYVRDLTLKDKLLVKEGDIVIAKSIKRINMLEKCKMFDITVADNHNFFLANGILSHNSGKDEALDYVQELAPMVSSKLPEEYKMYNLSGTESPEVYLDFWEIDSHGKATDKIIQGILSENDLLLGRECSFLFRNNTQTSRQNKQEILLQALEGRSIPNRLKSFGDKGAIDTLMKGVFIGVSRPVEEIKDSMLNSGLMQRCLFHVREINDKTRDQMTDIAASNCFPDGTTKGNFVKDMEDLAADIAKFVIFCKSAVFVPIDPQKLNAIIATRIKSYNALIRNTLKEDIHKQVATSFIGGFMNQSMLMAHINAGMRHDHKVTEEDLVNAFSVLESNLQTLMYWIEDMVDTQKTYTEMKMKEKYVEAIRKAFVGKTYLKRKQLLLIIQSVKDCSDVHGYNIIKKLTGGFIVEDKKNTFRLRSLTEPYMDQDG